jgi:hypothetical protein
MSRPLQKDFFCRTTPQGVRYDMTYASWCPKLPAPAKYTGMWNQYKPGTTWDPGSFIELSPSEGWWMYPDFDTPQPNRKFFMWYYQYRGTSSGFVDLPYKKGEGPFTLRLSYSDDMNWVSDPAYNPGPSESCWMVPLTRMPEDA